MIKINNIIYFESLEEANKYLKKGEKTYYNYTRLLYFNKNIGKACTRCKRYKKLSDFYEKKKGTEEYTTVCKKCQVEKNRIYRNGTRPNKEEKIDLLEQKRKEIFKNKNKIDL